MRACARAARRAALLGFAGLLLVVAPAPAAIRAAPVHLGDVPLPSAGDTTVARLAFSGPSQRPRLLASSTSLGPRDSVIGRALELGERRWVAWIVVVRAPSSGVARGVAAQRRAVRIVLVLRNKNERGALVKRVRRTYVNVEEEPTPPNTPVSEGSELARLGKLIEANDQLLGALQRVVLRIVVRDAAAALFDEPPAASGPPRMPAPKPAPAPAPPPATPQPGGPVRFGMSADSSHRHIAAGSSEVCFAIQSAPARPGATLRVRTTGPGVEGGGDQTVSLDGDGFRLVRVQISATGTYEATADATAADGATATTTKQHAVPAGAPGSGTCPPP